MLSDTKARQQALDVHESWLVQAPAGSGKTALLIQRLLALLGQAVDAPEQILAVTFTQKAAREMQERLLAALCDAESKPCPADPFQALTWQLAKQALAVDANLAWHVQCNPNRLRIMTIDAFCHGLVEQLPHFSHCGAGFSLKEDAKPLYEAAAVALLTDAAMPPEIEQNIMVLLQALDNRLDKLQQLLCDLLQKRDQWLDWAVQLSDTALLSVYLRETFDRLVSIHQQALIDSLDASLGQSLMDLASFSHAYLGGDKWQSNTWPLSLGVDSLTAWQHIARLLLTEEGGWRKKVDKQQGFPAPSTAKTAADKQLFAARKTQWMALIEQLSAQDELQAKWHAILMLPTLTEVLSEQTILQALLAILPRLVAHLHVQFETRQTLDFIELGMKTREALGALESPSDLQLMLDYQLRHILIDEFQDTSLSQYQFFQQLISGWEPGDGRTLFLVGDPMQSIYGFRGAEVSLFLHVKANGFGHLPIGFLALEANFRANGHLIGWFNAAFPRIFPGESDKTRGAIAYHPATPGRILERMGEKIHYLYPKHQRYLEAEAIVSDIQAIQQASPAWEIAILVRSRQQLRDILPALTRANIPFSAEGVHPILQQAAVQDAIVMVRAILDLGNPLAWASLLRSPLMGATMGDLLAIMEHDRSATIWGNLYHYHKLPLSSHFKKRLDTLFPILKKWIEQRRRLSLRQTCLRLWQLLGGETFYHQTQHWVMDCFERLPEDKGGDFLEWEEWLESLAKKYASFHQVEAKVHVMTIHKAKGLEFDAVILPDLSNITQSDGKALMHFMPIHFSEEVRWLMGSLTKNTYLKYLMADKQRFEIMRLLYVACTRAKTTLITYTACDEKCSLPRKQSLASVCWPLLLEEGEWLSPADEIEERTSAPSVKVSEPESMRVLSPDMQIPSCFMGGLQAEVPIDNENAAWQQQQAPLRHSWHVRYATRLGTLMHAVLEQIGSQPLSDWLAQFEPRQWLTPARLLAYGFSMGESSLVIEQLQSLKARLSDSSIAAWIFDAQHPMIKTEWALYESRDSQLQKAVLDRVFQTQETLWIVDFKTQSSLEHVSKKDWEDYALQLKNYARLLSLHQPDMSIKTGLYFPLCDEWRNLY